MRHGDPHLHVRGESVFVDDLPVPAGCLHAAVLGSPVAHGAITRLDLSAALEQPGVVAVLTALDIPGENQVGAILPDEPLLAEAEVHHVGEPVAVVLAETPGQARRARGHIVLDVEPRPVITDPREAAARGQLLLPARTFALGDVDTAWATCAHVVSGRVESGAQEHFYLETQGAQAQPTEHGAVHVHSSTQAPTGVQRQIAKILGVPMHMVQVDVGRLGGGFGGKEDQATHWAAICAVGARVTGRPVRLILDRAEDVRMTGKRHPYSSDFKLGLDKDGRFLAYEATYWQNAGSAADLSPAILERSLFHATASYGVPHVRATAMSCRTNLVPFTAYRGFGGPQAMFVMEAAIDAAARAMGVPARELQRRNLLREGTVLPYGMKTEHCHAVRCWDELDRDHDLAAMQRDVDAFNATAAGARRGLALMPVCFGISFTNTPMNQAGALVHVYSDGSVGVSTGAVEMGQGVNRKILRIAAATLGIGEELVRLETTNTTRVANTSPTAASTGADMNGMAALMACRALLGRLMPVAARRLGLGDDDLASLAVAGGEVTRDGAPTGVSWTGLVADAFLQRVDLSAHAHYATPRLHFDKATEKGRPFAYHVYGTAAVQVTLDTLRGTSTIDTVRIRHDVGRSLDESVDRGQIEGALAQGLGWMLLEDARWTDDGRLLHDTAGKYKVPDLTFTPADVRVSLLQDAPNPEAVLGSKAVGEPPFMYGIAGFFALRNAILAANPDADVSVTEAPLTPERTLALLRRGAPHSHDDQPEDTPT